jgi:hypothetical protein
MSAAVAAFAAKGATSIATPTKADTIPAFDFINLLIYVFNNEIIIPAVTNKCARKITFLLNKQLTDNYY